MWKYEKKLQFPINIKNPNPKLAKIIISQYGGADGELGASLRCGERSLLLSMTAGVKFTDEEYEAMRVVDKVNEGDNAVRWYGTILSMLIRQANEIVTLIEKK